MHRAAPETRQLAPAIPVGLLTRLAADANLIRSPVKMLKCGTEAAASVRKIVSSRLDVESEAGGISELSTEAPWGPRQFAEQSRSEQDLFLRDQELRRGGKHERLGIVASCERALQTKEEFLPLPNNVRLGRAGQPRRADNLKKAANKTTESPPKMPISQDRSPERKEYQDESDLRLQKHVAATEKAKKERKRLFGELETIARVERRENGPHRAIAAVMAARTVAEEHTDWESPSPGHQRDKRASSSVASPGPSQEQNPRYPLRAPEVDKDLRHRLNEERKAAALNGVLAKKHRAERQLQNYRAQREASISERRVRDEGRQIKAVNQRDRRLEQRQKQFTAQAEEADSNIRRRMQQLAVKRAQGWQEKHQKEQERMDAFQERQMAHQAMDVILDAARKLRQNKRGINTPDSTPEHSPRGTQAHGGDKSKLILPGLEKPAVKVDDDLGKTLEWFSIDAYRQQWGVKAPPARRDSTIVDTSKIGKRVSVLEIEKKGKVEHKQHKEKARKPVKYQLKDPTSSQLEAYGYDVDFERHIASQATQESKASKGGGTSPSATGGNRFRNMTSTASASLKSKRKSLLNLAAAAGLNSTAGFSDAGSELEDPTFVD